MDPPEQPGFGRTEEENSNINGDGVNGMSVDNVEYKVFSRAEENDSVVSAGGTTSATQPSSCKIKKETELSLQSEEGGLVITTGGAPSRNEAECDSSNVTGFDGIRVKDELGGIPNELDEGVFELPELDSANRDKAVENFSTEQTNDDVAANSGRRVKVTRVEEIMDEPTEESQSEADGFNAHEDSSDEVEPYCVVTNLTFPPGMTLTEVSPDSADKEDAGESSIQPEVTVSSIYPNTANTANYTRESEAGTSNGPAITETIPISDIVDKITESHNLTLEEDSSSEDSVDAIVLDGAAYEAGEIRITGVSSGGGSTILNTTLEYSEDVSMVTNKAVNRYSLTRDSSVATSQQAFVNELSSNSCEENDSCIPPEVAFASGSTGKEPKGKEPVSAPSPDLVALDSDDEDAEASVSTRQTESTVVGENRIPEARVAEPVIQDVSDDDDIVILDEKSCNDSVNAANEEQSEWVVEESEDWGVAEPQITPPSPPENDTGCFNCGGNHVLRHCRLPHDSRKIRKRREELHRRKKGRNSSNVSERADSSWRRYYETEQSLSEKYKNVRPGFISEKLRRAMGLRKDELPPYIYNMRKTGYPPGWLSNATETSSGLSIHDFPAGRSQGSGGCSSSAFHVNTNKLPEYPGFTTPTPKGFRDIGATNGNPFSFRNTLTNVADNWKRQQHSLSQQLGSSAGLIGRSMNVAHHSGSGTGTVPRGRGMPSWMLDNPRGNEGNLPQGRGRGIPRRRNSCPPEASEGIPHPVQAVFLPAGSDGQPVVPVNQSPIYINYPRQTINQYPIAQVATFRCDYNYRETEKYELLHRVIQRAKALDVRPVPRRSRSPSVLEAGKALLSLSSAGGRAHVDKQEDSDDDIEVVGEYPAGFTDTRKDSGKRPRQDSPPQGLERQTKRPRNEIEQTVTSESADQAQAQRLDEGKDKVQMREIIELSDSEGDPEDDGEELGSEEGGENDIELSDSEGEPENDGEELGSEEGGENDIELSDSEGEPENDGEELVSEDAEGHTTGATTQKSKKDAVIVLDDENGKCANEAGVQSEKTADNDDVVHVSVDEVDIAESGDEGHENEHNESGEREESEKMGVRVSQEEGSNDSGILENEEAASREHENDDAGEVNLNEESREQQIDDLGENNEESYGVDDNETSEANDEVGIYEEENLNEEGESRKLGNRESGQMEEGEPMECEITGEGKSD